MITEIKDYQQGNDIIKKWQLLFELEHLNIVFKYAQFEELNKQGMNYGVFKSTNYGGYMGKPITIAILNDWGKRHQADKRNDELEIVRNLCEIRSKIDIRKDWYY